MEELDPELQDAKADAKAFMDLSAHQNEQIATLRTRLERAREALKEGDEATLAFVLDVPVETIRRLGGLQQPKRDKAE